MKKNEQFQRPVGYHQVYQHMHNGSLNGDGEGKGRNHI